MNKTRIAPLPYKGAPLTVQDLIQQQVEFEDRMYPHLIYTPSQEELTKELPAQTWSPAAQYVFGINTRFFKFLLP